MNEDPPRMLRRFLRSAEPDQDIGELDQPLRSLDPDCLNLVVSRAEAGRIG